MFLSSNITFFTNRKIPNSLNLCVIFVPITTALRSYIPPCPLLVSGIGRGGNGRTLKTASDACPPVGPTTTFRLPACIASTRGTRIPRWRRRTHTPLAQGRSRPCTPVVSSMLDLATLDEKHCHAGPSYTPKVSLATKFNGVAIF